MQSCAFKEEIGGMVNHLFIIIWHFLYSRHFFILLFIISQERYPIAASAETFLLFCTHPYKMQEQRNLVSS